MYQIVEDLSSNQIWKAHVARSANSGKLSFLKTVADGDTPLHRLCAQRLRSSFSLQQQIVTRKILTADEIEEQNGIPLVAYPLLDRKQWKQVSGIKNVDLLCELLPEIAWIVDYLHALDLVHGDLKLENFLYREVSGSRKLLLIDLDFLSRDGVDAAGQLYGTLQYLAPEIERNGVVVTQSDNYALGGSLATFVSEISGKSKSGNKSIENLTELSKRLCHPDYLARPYSLIEALVEHGLLDADAASEHTNRLFRAVMLARLKGTDQKRLGEHRQLRQFILDECRIVGMPDEISDALSAIWRDGKRHWMAQVKAYLLECTVSRAGEFWVIQGSDRGMRALFTAAASPNRKSTPGPLEEYLFLLDEKVPNVNRSSRHLQLGALASRLNRPIDAARWYRTLIEREKSTSREYQQGRIEWITSMLRVGELEPASVAIASELEKSQEQESFFYWSLRRLRGWVALQKREFEEAFEDFDATVSAAEKKDYKELCMTASYSIAVGHWMQGRPELANDNLENAFKSGAGIVDQTLRVPSIAMQALLLNELGQYVDALKATRLARRIISRESDNRSLPAVCFVGTVAHIRLGNFLKAKEMLEQYLALGDFQDSTMHLLNYYQTAAFLHLNSGEVVRARAMVAHGLRLPTHAADARIRAKLHQIAAELALVEGRFADAQQHLQEASSRFSGFQDEASIAEVAFLEHLASSDYERLDWSRKLLEHVSGLLKHRSMYYASFASVVALATSEREWLRTQSILVNLWQGKIYERTTPVFRALEVLLGRDRNTLEDKEFVRALKDAQRIFVGLGQKFVPALLSVAIARMYQYMDRNPGYARSQYGLGLFYARQIGNQFLLSRIEKESKQIESKGTDHKRLLLALQAITGLLNNLTDYRESLNRIVEFAVEHTTAERGALLLKGESNDRYRVVASIECDAMSLIDLPEISLSIVGSVVKESTAIVVTDALLDDRTKTFPSVLRHNIRSAAAFPLRIDDQLIGVLYVDHHGIPALFRDEDLWFLDVLTGTLSVLLRTAQEFRYLKSVGAETTARGSRRSRQATFVTEKKELINGLLAELPKFARSTEPILLLGESGTGKEILCNMIHQMSGRNGKPLIKVNCSAIQPTMAEAEFFGITKGAATNVSEREGKFSAADEGTLFMDEIGDLPIEIQPKLLRALEYQTYQKVGSNTENVMDIRFVYGSNRDIEKMVREGTFRRDLWYRISSLVLNIPPLRERVEDIPLLIEHFNMEVEPANRRIKFAPDAMEILMRYEWPGNVRELRNLVDRFLVLEPGRKIDAEMLPKYILKRSETTDMKSSEASERERFRAAYAEAGENQSRAARLCGLPLSTWRRKARKYGIIP